MSLSGYMAICSCVGDPQDAARVIFIIRNTAVTKPAVGHDGVETGVGHGNATAGGRRLGAVNEGIDGGIPAMLLFDFGIPSPPHGEEGSSEKTT